MVKIFKNGLDRPRWGQDESARGQDGAKRGQVGAKMAILKPFGEPSWERHLRKWRKSKIEREYNVLVVFWDLGGSGWRFLGRILGDLGHKLGSLGRSWPQGWALLEDLGVKLGTSWQDVGTKVAEDGLRRPT